MEAKETFNLDTHEPIGTLYYMPMELPGAEMTSIIALHLLEDFSQAWELGQW